MRRVGGELEAEAAGGVVEDDVGCVLAAEEGGRDGGAEAGAVEGEEGGGVAGCSDVPDWRVAGWGDGGGHVWIWTRWMLGRKEERIGDESERYAELSCPSLISGMEAAGHWARLHEGSVAHMQS